ncbi:MAG: CoA-binding protein [Deltaproteobacteria bacterium]|nr:CoA-binding protein [Deltaproteobacteria bacterium]
MNKKTMELDDIFSPRGVAVVGASAKNLAFAEIVLHSLIEAEFPAIYPVNPKYNEVLGLKCYPRLLDIPGIVDHVVVNIPAESALSLLDECAEKSVKSVHFFTAGFGESGVKERADLENKLLEKAKAGGFRIIGPNCVGLFVPKSRLVNLFGMPINPGPIGFISQSGGHAQNLPLHSGPRGLRFSKVISYGNALDVNEIELLQYFTQDDETKIVAAYIEGVKDGEKFRNALTETASKKPVVLYKGGNTEAGKRTAYGHTASMTSSVEIFNAMCHQAGVIKVNNIDEMIDVLVALCFAEPVPEDTGIALIGAGGGASVLAGDEMEKEGLKLPGFSSAVKDELKQHLPLAGSIFTNPLDTPNLATPKAIATAMDILGKVPEIHMLAYHLGFHPIGSWGHERFSTEAFYKPVINAMKKTIQETGKPVLIALRPPLDLPGMKEFLVIQKAFEDAGLPVFHSLGNLAKAMSKIIKWKNKQLSTKNHP